MVVAVEETGMLIYGDGRRDLDGAVVPYAVSLAASCASGDVRNGK